MGRRRSQRLGSRQWKECGVRESFVGGRWLVGSGHAQAVAAAWLVLARCAAACCAIRHAPPPAAYLHAHDADSHALHHCAYIKIYSENKTSASGRL